MKATGILVLTTLSFIAFVFFFQSMGTFKLLFAVIFIATFLSYFLQKAVERKKAEKNTKTGELAA
jgi:hypothetical protein